MRRFAFLLMSMLILTGCARLEAEPEKERPKEERPFMGVFYQRAPVRTAESDGESAREDVQPFTP